MRSLVCVTGLSSIIAIASGCKGELIDGGVHDRSSSLNASDGGANDAAAALGMTTVAVGEAHMCVVKHDGSVWCLGDNSVGQLGNGTRTDSSLPVPVSGMSNVVAIAATDASTCAIKHDGSLWCWGGYFDDHSVVINGSLVPVAVAGISDVASVSLFGWGFHEGHVCAVKSDGSLWCWDIGIPVPSDGGGDPSAYDAGSPIDGGGDPSAYDAGSPIDGGGDPSADGGTWSDAGECWNGNVGFTMNYSSVPVAVQGMSNVAAVASNGATTCAIKQDGSLWCWGDNTYGDLGIGPTTNYSSIPVAVQGMSNVAKVSIGVDSVCAIKRDGSLWCWGNIDYEQISPMCRYNYDAGSQPNTHISFVPVAINWAGSNVTDVVVGGSHTCGVTHDGSISCWGMSASGRNDDSSDLSGLSNIAAAFANVSDIFAVTTDGSIWQWRGGGRCSRSRIRVLSSQIHPDKSSIDARLIWRMIMKNHAHVISQIRWGLPSVIACAIGCSGALSGGCSGQAVDGAGASTSNSFGAGIHEGISARGTTISVGYQYACAVKKGGSLWCWGNNSAGQLGNGTTTGSSVPVAVLGISNIATVSAGYGVTCTVIRDGSLWCWGDDSNYQLGNKTTVISSAPIFMPGMTNVANVSVGDMQTCAVKQDESLWCMGRDSGSDEGPIDSVPAAVAGMSNVAAASAGTYHTCAVKQDGSLWCWGNNGNGELGIGTTTSASVPVAVPGMSNVADVAIGVSSTCAVKQDGSLWCWGNNGNGELGIGTTTNASVPAAVAGMSNVVAVSVGYQHTCAVKKDASLWCWGSNTYGELGNGTTMDSSIPVRVSSMSNVAAVSIGVFSTCAINLDESVWCWGANDAGQLGNGGTANSAVPVRVVGF